MYFFSHVCFSFVVSRPMCFFSMFCFSLLGSGPMWFFPLVCFSLVAGYPRNIIVYLRDKSAETVVLAVILVASCRLNWQSHSVRKLILAQRVRVITPWCQASNRVDSRIPMHKSLVWLGWDLNSGSPALEVDAFTTSPLWVLVDWELYLMTVIAPGKYPWSTTWG